MHRAEDVVFVGELLIPYQIETSVASDLVAVLSGCCVLADFQSSNVTISKLSYLRTCCSRFDVEIVIPDQYAILCFESYMLSPSHTFSRLLKVGVQLAFEVFARLVFLEVLQTGKTLRALLE
jgi:hypothetical protein